MVPPARGTRPGRFFPELAGAGRRQGRPGGDHRCRLAPVPRPPAGLRPGGPGAGPSRSDISGRRRRDATEPRPFRRLWLPLLLWPWPRPSPVPWGRAAGPRAGSILGVLLVVPKRPWCAPSSFASGCPGRCWRPWSVPLWAAPGAPSRRSFAIPWPIPTSWGFPGAPPWARWPSRLRGAWPAGGADRRLPRRPGVPGGGLLGRAGPAQRSPHPDPGRGHGRQPGLGPAPLPPLDGSGRSAAYRHLLAGRRPLRRQPELARPGRALVRRRLSPALAAGPGARPLHPGGRGRRRPRALRRSRPVDVSPPQAP